MFPTTYLASKSFYKLHCYYFLISLDTYQRRILWLRQRFSFRGTILFESVARQSHQRINDLLVRILLGAVPINSAVATAAVSPRVTSTDRFMR